MYGDDVLKDLVGRTVTAVYWSDSRITFDTDSGPLSYRVEGDCCSHSYLFDLIGYDKLLAGPVVSTNRVDVGVGDLPEDDWNVTVAYGFQIVTMHPNWGEVTTAISFRNESNGYYGGWMERDRWGGDEPDESQELLTGDKVG